VTEDHYIVSSELEKAETLAEDYGSDIWFDDLDYAKDIAATVGKKVYRVTMRVEEVA